MTLVCCFQCWKVRLQLDVTAMEPKETKRIAPSTSAVTPCWISNRNLNSTHIRLPAVVFWDLRWVRSTTFSPHPSALNSTCAATSSRYGKKSNFFFFKFPATSLAFYHVHPSYNFSTFDFSIHLFSFLDKTEIFTVIARGAALNFSPSPAYPTPSACARLLDKTVDSRNIRIRHRAMNTQKYFDLCIRIPRSLIYSQY